MKSEKRYLLLMPFACFLWVWGGLPPSTKGFDGDSTRADTTARRHLPNIILISLDTTRADHLSVYGYPLATTPHLKRFAQRAVVFENASTVVPLTGPSHASMFTSLYPHQHGAFRNGIPLDEAEVTLPEALAGYGYDTAAFISGWTLRKNVCGLNQGFRFYEQTLGHRYKVLNRERLAEELHQPIKSFLEHRRKEGPLFLFVHCFDPHDPYRRHKNHWQGLRGQAARLGLMVPEKVLAYDNEISYMDFHLGRLIDMLEAKGFLAESILIIVGDHGESLGEHGYWGHGRRVYETNLKVPLLLYAPGRIPGPTTVQDPFTTLDILPTLFGLLGVPLPDGFAPEGRDLSNEIIHGRRFPAQRLYFQTYKGTLKTLTRVVARESNMSPLLLGFYENNLKYILRPSTGDLEVFDLSTDRTEARDIASQHTEPSLGPDLMSWFRRGQNTAGVRINLSREEIEQLKGLGYID
jgi:hypothetical protein